MGTGKSEDTPSTPTGAESAPELDPEAKVPRFTRTERSLHWVLTLVFFILLLTGFVLGSGLGGVAGFLYSPSLSTWFGNRDVVKQIHIIVGFLFVLGPIAFLVFNRRAILRSVLEIDRWDKDDILWLFSRLKRPQGKFNAGQKFNTIFTVAAAIIFLATGFIMWKWTLFPEWLRDNAIFTHDWLTVLIVFFVVGHIYLALINPRTRESLRGITVGWVKARYVRSHHRKWYEQVVKAKGGSEESRRPSGRKLMRLFKRRKPHI